MKFDSPVERFPGHIELPDYLSFPKLLSWEKAIEETKALKKGAGVGEFYKQLLPVCISFVEKWHIIGLNVNADGTPILDSTGNPIKPDYCNFPANARLISFLVSAVSDLYTETNRTDPN